MAIAHLAAKVVAAGRSPISAAAYRHRTTMHDVARGMVVSYEDAGDELAHEELALPADAPAWVREMLDGRTVAKGSEAFWTAVWDHEKRVDAQTAREVEVALPKELDVPQQVALMREFIESQVTDKGMVADWVIHNKDGNPHAHIMHTLRPLTAQGFGGKSFAILGADGEPLRANGKIVYRRFMPGDKTELRDMRASWGNVVNRHLALAGHDVRIDMRSYATQGIAITPTTHIGSESTELVLSGIEARALQKHLAAKAAAARDIDRTPAALLKKIASQTSTFTERDIAKALTRYLTEPQAFANALAGIRASAELKMVRPEVRDPLSDAVVAPAVFSTREVLRAERKMAEAVDLLAKRGGFAVRKSRVDAAIARVEGKNPAKAFSFDDEQKLAVAHITGAQGVAAVVGFAGAGKSTLLEAAHSAWVADGRRVFGGALAGKAAQGLEDSAGIASRTLAAWELAWDGGRDRLQSGDVFVIDEAGMVGSQQMSRIAQIIAAAGAKLVLVGDAMQLQPIEAGAAFRAITDRIGFAELVGIRRQKAIWAQEASRQFARGQVAEALEAYRSRGHWTSVADHQAATKTIVADYLTARTEIAAKAAAAGKPIVGNETLVLAHSNDAVYALNQGIREALKAEGELTGGHAMTTERGSRDFAPDDRMIFLRNEKFTEAAAPELGRQSVKNGMLATVISTESGLMRVRLDSGREVAFRPSTYRNVDHGYAATIHKSQGVTVDRVFVFGTKGFDQHLSYVAMSRHRQQVTLYTAESDFKTFGQVVRTMAKSGAKTTTLDYENQESYQAATADFLVRRGIDTVADIIPALQATLERQRAWIATQARTVAELWDRAGTVLERLQAVEQRAPTIDLPTAVTATPGDTMVQASSLAIVRTTDIRPPSPIIAAYQGHPAVTEFTISTEHEARLSVTSDATWIQSETQLRVATTAVFSDPDAAMAAIQRVTTAPGAKAAELARQATETPEHFGAVLSRSTARTAAADLAPHIRAQVATFARELPAALQQESERRTAMATAIPALSANAVDALQTIEAARLVGGDSAAANATRLTLGNKNLTAELVAANEALTARFGWKAFGPKAEDDDTAKALQRVPEAERAALVAAAPTLAALRGFANAAHFAERRETAHTVAEASPLRSARIIPALTTAELDTALRADDAGRKYRAEAERLAVIAFGSSKPVAAMLDKIVADPRVAADVALSINTKANYPAPLVGKLEGLLRKTPDAARQNAQASLAPLVDAIGTYGDYLVNVKSKILSNQSGAQAQAKIEIAAPSPGLALALGATVDPADARDVAAKVAANPAAVTELVKLRTSLENGLARDDRALLTKGDAAAVATRLNMSPDQAQRLIAVNQQSAQLAKHVQEHQRQAIKLSRAPTIQR